MIHWMKLILVYVGKAHYLGSINKNRLPLFQIMKRTFHRLRAVLNLELALGVQCSGYLRSVAMATEKRIHTHFMSSIGVYHWSLAYNLNMRALDEKFSRRKDREGPWHIFYKQFLQLPREIGENLRNYGQRNLGSNPRFLSTSIPKSAIVTRMKSGYFW